MTTSQTSTTALQGSSLYYALLPYKAEQRQQALALIDVYTQMQRILFDCSDEGVARTKMLWWQDEMKRCSEGEARHPSTVALQPMLDAQILDANQLQPLAQAMFFRLQHLTLPDQQHFQQYCQPTAWLVHQLSRVAGNRTQQDAETELAHIIQKIDSIRHLRRYCLNQRIPLILDELQTHQVDPEQLYQLNSSQPLQQWIQHSYDELNQRYSKLVLPPAYKQSAIYTRCQLATLKCYLQDDVFKRHHRLTPIKKWWIAKQPI